jgi:colanic acid biosynthesis glycosyl transferase WcaI
LRILIYGINFYPELTGIGKYTGEMAFWLSLQGHEVRVVTAPPYYPDWQVSTEYSATRYSRETLSDNLKVWRCPLWVPSRPSGLTRLVHLATFALSSLPIAFSQIVWRPQVVFLVEPPLFCVPVGRLTAWLAGGQSWLHIQDFEIDAAFELGLLKSERLRRWVTGLERCLLRSFHRVSTISEKMQKRLRDKGVREEAVISFPNWVDTDDIKPLPVPSRFRQELGVGSDTMVALYSGNMGEKQGLDIVVETARKLQAKDDLLFVMCGDGAARERLQAVAVDLDNIRWLPLQPVERLNELLNMADIHLLPQRADAADLVMPSKLTGMLASGRPVVATALEGTQVAQVLDKAGVVVPPGDVDQFAEALVRLTKDPDIRKQMGEVGRRFALENLGRDAVLSIFEKNLKVLLTK